MAVFASEHPFTTAVDISSTGCWNQSFEHVR
jgi:hypothetical protein